MTALDRLNSALGSMASFPCIEEQHRDESLATVEVRITPAIAAEYSTRDVFTFVKGPGLVMATVEEVAEMLDDADFYTDKDGPGYQALNIGQRGAYDALRKQLLNIGKDSDRAEADKTLAVLEGDDDKGHWHRLYRAKGMS